MTNPIDNHRSSIINHKSSIQGSSIINWNEVHRRLDAAQEALGKGWSPSESEKKRILKTRAEVLAREPEKSEPGEEIEVVEFTLSHEKYGGESHYVREVYPLKEYTPVPCTPAFVLGIINLRGEILSILDLRKFFDLPETGLGDLNRVVVLSFGDMAFGVLADVITGVRKVALDGLQPPPLPTLVFQSPINHHQSSIPTRFPQSSINHHQSSIPRLSGSKRQSSTPSCSRPKDCSRLNSPWEKMLLSYGR